MRKVKGFKVRAHEKKKKILNQRSWGREVQK